MPNLDLTEAIGVVNAKTTQGHLEAKRVEGLKLKHKTGEAYEN